MIDLTQYKDELERVDNKLKSGVLFDSLKDLMEKYRDKLDELIKVKETINKEAMPRFAKEIKK
jgi:hypothetical protein